MSRRIDKINQQIALLQRRIALIDIQINSLQARKQVLIAEIDSRISPFNNNKQQLINQITQLENEKNSLVGGDASTFGQMVLNVHNAMMTYLEKAGSLSNSFIIPYIPQNYNYRLDWAGVGGSPMLQECSVSTLGSDSGGIVTYAEVYGVFVSGAGVMLNSGATAVQLRNSRYRIIKIITPPNGIGQPMKEYFAGPNSNLLVTNLNPTARNAILYVANRLTRWAQQTAFLTIPGECMNYWTSRYGDGIQSNGAMVQPLDRMNNSVPQTPTVSSKDRSIILPNSLQKDYYDRLYDFMQTKGYTNSATSYDVVINLLQTFSGYPI